MTDVTQAPKRLTLSHIVEMLLAEQEHEATFVRLSRNQKGGTDIEVVVAVDPSRGVADLLAAREAAQDIYDELRQSYPPAEQEASSDRQSVTLSRNAKGETQMEVTTHTAGVQAEGHTRVTFDRLRSTYPMSDGFVGAREAAAQMGVSGENDVGTP